MPTDPANNPAGAHTIRKSSQPISQHTAPTMTTNAALVASTLLRTRGCVPRATSRGSMIMANTGPEPEHHYRMTEQPVGKPTPPRTSLVLGDRQRLDIALRRGGRDPLRSRGARRARGAMAEKA